MTVRLLPYGRDAVLVEVDDPAEVHRAAACVRDRPGVVEVVPGARTVLLRCVPGTVSQVRDRVPQWLDDAADHEVSAPAPVVLDVVYDGADLADTAALLGLSPEALVRAHCAARYTVAFCGFAPGFAYLTGLPEPLRTSRLAQPRTRVPAGSVGIADGFTGVYPRSSPGGWRLLGATSAPLWNADREPPALLAPGTPVRFRDIT